MTPQHREALRRAQARLDSLSLYPRPVRIDRVSIRVAPWFFRLPLLRRYHGYALVRTIVVRRPDPSDDLVTHELCHVWQMQHRPLRMPLSYLRTGYRRSPYERQAREAARLTKD